MELCHFFFSSTLSGTSRTLINIYEAAICIDSYRFEVVTKNLS